MVGSAGLPWRYNSKAIHNSLFNSPSPVRRPLGYINVGGGRYTHIASSPYAQCDVSGTPLQRRLQEKRSAAVTEGASPPFDAMGRDSHTLHMDPATASVIGSRSKAVVRALRMSRPSRLLDRSPPSATPQKPSPPRARGGGAVRGESSVFCGSTPDLGHPYGTDSPPASVGVHPGPSPFDYRSKTSGERRTSPTVVRNDDRCLCHSTAAQPATRARDEEVLRGEHTTSSLNTSHNGGVLRGGDGAKGRLIRDVGTALDEYLHSSARSEASIDGLLRDKPISSTSMRPSAFFRHIFQQSSAGHTYSPTAATTSGGKWAGEAKAGATPHGAIVLPGMAPPAEKGDPGRRLLSPRLGGTSRAENLDGPLPLQRSLNFGAVTGGAASGISISDGRLSGRPPRLASNEDVGYEDRLSRESSCYGNTKSKRTIPTRSAAVPTSHVMNSGRSLERSAQSCSQPVGGSRLASNRSNGRRNDHSEVNGNGRAQSAPSKPRIFTKATASRLSNAHPLRTGGGLSTSMTSDCTQSCKEWLDDIFNSVGCATLAPAGIQKGSHPPSHAVRVSPRSRQPMRIPIHRVDMRWQFKPLTTADAARPERLGHQLAERLQQLDRDFLGDPLAKSTRTIQFSRMTGVRSQQTASSDATNRHNHGDEKRPRSRESARMTVAVDIPDGLPFESYSTVRVKQPSQPSAWALAPARDPRPFPPGHPATRRCYPSSANHGDGNQGHNDSKLIQEVRIDEHLQPYVLVKEVPTGAAAEAQRDAVKRLSKPKPVYVRAEVS